MTEKTEPDPLCAEISAEFNAEISKLLTSTIPRTVRKVIFALAVLGVGAGVFVASAYWDTRDYVASVKNTQNPTYGVTMGEMLERNFENQRWTFERTDWNTHYVHYKVTFRGTIPEKTHALTKEWIKKAIVESHVVPGWENDEFAVALVVVDMLAHLVEEYQNPQAQTTRGAHDGTGLPESAQAIWNECEQKYFSSRPVLDSPKEVRVKLERMRAGLAQAVSSGDERDIQERRQTLEELESGWEQVLRLSQEPGYHVCMNQLEAITEKTIDDFFWVTGNEVYIVDP